MPPKRRNLSAPPESEHEDQDFKGLVKKVAQESHAQAEAKFLDRFRNGTVAVYTGTNDRHANAHIAEFVGTMNADALVFIEQHRSNDLVSRTLDNLPPFDQIPVRITHTTHAPFLTLAKSLQQVQELQFQFEEVEQRRVLRRTQRGLAWGVMAAVKFIQDDQEKQLLMLVAGGCSAFQMFAFLAQHNVPVHQITTPE